MSGVAETDSAANDETAFAAEVQRRLLDHEPIASDDFCAHYLEALTDWLQRRYPTTEEGMVEDAVVQTLLDHIERPQRFDPARRSLRGYLKMAAERDLKNLRARHRPRLERESVMEPVELEAAAGKNSVAGDDPLADDVIARDVAARQAARIMAAAQTEEERQVLTLMMEGEKDTTVFAAALGLADLPPAQQRDRVYAIKDRLVKRLRRQGRGEDD